MRQSKVVITDCSSFILLQKIDALYILNELYNLVITTPEIAKEYGAPLPHWVIIEPVRNLKLQEEFYQQVDLGEATAIALAYEIHPDFVILDDLEARKLATKLGLPIKGAAGVLLEAKLEGVIERLKPYLNLIEQTNFRLGKSVIETVLRLADEA